LVMAARQKDLYRQSHAAKPQTLKGYEPKLRELAKACGPFIAREKQSRQPVAEEKGRGKAPEVKPTSNLHLKLAAAQRHLAKFSGVRHLCTYSAITDFIGVVDRGHFASADP
jgi:hypothetical protein